MSSFFGYPNRSTSLELTKFASTSIDTFDRARDPLFRVWRESTESGIGRSLVGRKLCELENGQWLLFEKDGYYLGKIRLQTETALLILIDQCKTDYMLEWSLQSLIPEGDSRIIKRAAFEDAMMDAIPVHEKYLIEMLGLKEPPKWDSDYDFELIHPASLSSDLSDEYLSKALPLCNGFIWDGRFAEAIRNHRPNRSPLTRWEVFSTWTDMSPDVSKSFDQQLKAIWAFSESRIRLAHFGYPHLR